MNSKRLSIIRRFPKVVKIYALKLLARDALKLLQSDSIISLNYIQRQKINELIILLASARQPLPLLKIMYVYQKRFSDHDFIKRNWVKVQDLYVKHAGLADIISNHELQSKSLRLAGKDKLYISDCIIISAVSEQLPAMFIRSVLELVAAEY